MTILTKLRDLLQLQFPKAKLPAGEDLALGSFPEWDSLGHFNYLMLVEENFAIRFGIEETSELKSLPEIARAVRAKGVDAG